MIKTRHDSAGRYTVQDTRNAHAYVHVIRNDALTGPDKWIALAGWDRFLVTDPLPTKRDAIAQAIGMINEQYPA